MPSIKKRLGWIKVCVVLAEHTPAKTNPEAQKCSRAAELQPPERRAKTESLSADRSRTVHLTAGLWEEGNDEFFISDRSRSVGCEEAFYAARVASP